MNFNEQLNQKKDELKVKNNEITALKERLLVLESIDSVKNRDNSILVFILSILRDNHRERRSQSTSIERSSKKSTKVSDSSLLIDDINSIFLNWKLKIEDKLSININYFLIDDNKTAYIYLRIEDDAAEHLNAYRINDSRYFKIFEQVLKILSSIYDDLNRKENARYKFKRLKMILEISFYLFYNHFLRFATIAEISEDYLLKELKNRILSRMQKTMFDVSFIAKTLNKLKTYLT